MIKRESKRGDRASFQSINGVRYANRVLSQLRAVKEFIIAGYGCLGWTTIGLARVHRLAWSLNTLQGHIFGPLAANFDSINAILDDRCVSRDIMAILVLEALVFGFWCLFAFEVVEQFPLVRTLQAIAHVSGSRPNLVYDVVRVRIRAVSTFKANSRVRRVNDNHICERLRCPTLDQGVWNRIPMGKDVGNLDIQIFNLHDIAQEEDKYEDNLPGYGTEAEEIGESSDYLVLRCHSVYF